MKKVNDKLLSQLEEKSNIIKQLESELSKRDLQKLHDEAKNIGNLRKENSILATQLRDLQEELVENSNISKIYSKNASNLEVSNQLLSERCANLERENKEYEDKINYLNESQERSNLQGIHKLKGKINKLKDTLKIQNEQCTQYEHEIIKANQIIETKNSDLTTVAMQYNELKANFEAQVQAKEVAFLERIKGNFLF